MLRTLRIALALLRIPHLALSLFAFPLLLSLIIVSLQLFTTAAIVQLANPSTQAASTLPAAESDHNQVRWLIYGSGAPRAPLKICRWKSSNGRESPPDSECQQDRLDLAIHAPDPQTFDVTRFARLFEGHVDRLHVCVSCAPDAVIALNAHGAAKSTAHSLFGLAILFLPYSNQSIVEQRVALHHAYDDVQETLGSVSLRVPEISDSIGISALKGTLPITANIAIVVIIALWLAIRAHRKVLDYFSRNDVLLPLAAACGKNAFYSAIWLLTLFRVGCFLCASIPLMYLGLSDIIASNVKEIDFSFSILQWSVWLLTLILTCSFATVIASIAELKHRHALMSVAYKFLPLLGAFVGAVVWGASFVMPLHLLGVFRMAISALPVVGIAPMLVAPITGLPYLPMTIHAALALLALIWILKGNARWFAAHLEEV